MKRMESEERIDTGKNRRLWGRECNKIAEKIPEFQKEKIMKIPLNRIKNSLGIVIKKIHRGKLNKKKGGKETSANKKEDQETKRKISIYICKKL